MIGFTKYSYDLVHQIMVSFWLSFMQPRQDQREYDFIRSSNADPLTTKNTERNTPNSCIKLQTEENGNGY